MKKAEASKETTPVPELLNIPIDRILEPELPARCQMDQRKMDELIESLRSVGQIVPITVTRTNGMYQIETGHRRWFAARALGWSHMTAIVTEHTTPETIARMAHENAMREDLNPAEEALWFAQAQDKLKLDEAGLVALFKRTAEYISSRLALLRGDPEVFATLQRGEIRVGVAHQLNRITDEVMRRYYLDCARRSDPPARVVQQWVADWAAQSGGKDAIGRAVADAAAFDRMGGPSADLGNTIAGAAGAVGPNTAQPFWGCELCGGDRDPHNLVTIRIHSWEWERIIDTVRRAAAGA